MKPDPGLQNNSLRSIIKWGVVGATIHIRKDKLPNEVIIEL
tara:strand:+ start:328 stop:450 length:123 start_codon:yes stop_codon:yes gene_type:complete